jgi:hypothetical protein
MRYLGLRTNRPTFVIKKMVNKWVIRLEGVISSVIITVMKVSTIVDFHVVLEEDGAYLMILGRPLLTKSHVRNYWGKGYMTIGVNLNWQKIPFVNFVNSSWRTSEYDDESKIDQAIATPLWGKCEDETHTPKSGNLESSRTPENAELDCMGQNTLHWNVPYTVGKFLKCRCWKWPCMSHSDICSTNYGRKKGQESNR